MQTPQTLTHFYCAADETEIVSQRSPSSRAEVPEIMKTECGVSERLRPYLRETQSD